MVYGKECVFQELVGTGIVAGANPYVCTGNSKWLIKKMKKYSLLSNIFCTFVGRTIDIERLKRFCEEQKNNYEYIVE